MNWRVKFFSLLLATMSLCINEGSGKSLNPSVRRMSPTNENLIPDFVSFKKKAKPTPGTAPLDINETINHELESLTQILGIVTGGVSGLIAGLTGISITDCATQIKGQDLNSLTCAQFIDELSKCDSLMHVKDLLQAAKKRFKKNPNSKKPCFQ